MVIDMRKRTAGPILTVEALVEWLATQDGEQRYEFFDNSDCLTARFVTAQGFKNVSVGGWAVSVGEHTYELPARLAAISFKKPWTYSAALKRAEGGA